MVAWFFLVSLVLLKVFWSSKQLEKVVLHCCVGCFTGFLKCFQGFMVDRGLSDLCVTVFNRLALPWRFLGFCILEYVSSLVFFLCHIYYVYISTKLTFAALMDS